MHILADSTPRFCCISFSKIDAFGGSEVALALQLSWLDAALSAAFPYFFAWVNPGGAAACGLRPKI
jgi:hypothetical protein